MRQYTFEKKLAIEEMLIEQITEFELRDPGLPGHTCCTPKTDYVYDNTKISNEDLRLNYYLLLKYCRRQCTLLPSSLPGPNYLQNLTPISKIFSAFWT